MSGPILITKSDGTQEEFNLEKLRGSLRHAGANDSLIAEITSHIGKELVSGMTTTDIYRHAFSMLHVKARPVAARYSLRRAVLALGPTGFPFERFAGELLKRQGFSVEIGQMVQGKCVDHEVDIVAWNESKLIMAEAKYHHELGYKSDLKVVLYVKARFDDLREGRYTYGSHTKLTEGWLVTNTKFTNKAISYSECSDVHLLGWNYPKEENLHHLIEQTRLHPITCLTTFSEKEKALLLSKGMVLCENIRENDEALSTLGFSKDAIGRARSESALLCPVN